jgi:hypothetical protein
MSSSLTTLFTSGSAALAEEQQAPMRAHAARGPRDALRALRRRNLFSRALLLATAQRARAEARRLAARTARRRRHAAAGKALASARAG